MAHTGAVILAAGKGTRMHSDRPKVLQTLLGESMLSYVLRAVEPLCGDSVWTVVGHGAHMVTAAFPAARCVHQAEQLGTGHAVMQALPAVREGGCHRVLVVNGDTPLVRTETLRSFLEAAGDADVAFATIHLDDPGAYGRVVRAGGLVRAIVEAKDYDAALHGTPTGEVNAGIYLLKLDVLERLLPQLGCQNRSGEYYLTDVVALAVAEGLNVLGVDCGRDASLFGINSPLELAASEERLRADIVRDLLRSGVMIHHPAGVVVGPRAVVEPGAELCGPCEIYGESRVERGALVQSHCVLRNARVAGGAEIRSFSHLEQAEVAAGALVGPYARLRPGAVLEEDSHVGNFVELKKTRLGRGAKANHLTYLGDAQIGAGTNIGAGTITCNYDGKNKFATIIGERAFIGSNTALVAPVAVGDDALIGAGSVITRDVPEGQMGIARARQTVLPRRVR
ncbi:MAG: bifunctional UDP-N-acetylglucosamine diphosphorylase/glucosamine-1-phosphate N-acetyltransferase GlmU [Desulfovibrionaceae bacterium]|nr:bifunctional UDP-N-acetylglucosamine diphosphorylase/glucosamine-1-phosphate N-acetyltransferase GlmU [Desulfovibrionaceae bacterium]